MTPVRHSGLTLGSLKEGVGIALDSLRANKTRAALTILGIAIGVSVVMTMAAAVRGVNNAFDNIFKEIGPTTFFVFRFQGGRDADDDESAPKWWSYPPLSVQEAAVLRRLPSVEGVMLMGGNSHTVTFGPTEATMEIAGRSANWVQIAGGDMINGRSYLPVEEQLAEHVCVLSDVAATILFGTRDPVGQSVKTAGQSFRVLGVYRPPPNLFNAGSGGVVLVPYITYRRYVAMWWENGWMNMMVRPVEGVPQQQAIDDVVTALRRSRSLRPAQENNFAIVSQDKIMDQWNKLTGVFFMVMIALSGVALMVGGIGVVAIMMISVTERTREIGVRKALGATRTEIMWQFLIEAATLTMVGGAVGMAFGGAAVVLINALTPLQAAVPPLALVASLAASIITGIVFGLVPANRASRLDPVEALRYE